MSLVSSALAQQAAVEQPSAAPHAGEAAGKSEERQTLATFYAMQLLIGECNVQAGARDQTRLKKVLELMELGTGPKPAELARIKGSVLTEISTDKEKSCTEGRIQLGMLGTCARRDEQAARRPHRRQRTGTSGDTRRFAQRPHRHPTIAS